MAINNKKLWALVKWVGGDDDKQFTLGINVDHIKNFNYKKFKDNKDPEQVYVVEWRDSKKEPIGGWTCHNAIIIAVSTSKVILEKKLKALDGVISPGPKTTWNKDDEYLTTPGELSDDPDTSDQENNENQTTRKKLKFAKEHEFSPKHADTYETDITVSDDVETVETMENVDDKLEQMGKRKSEINVFSDTKNKDAAAKYISVEDAKSVIEDMMENYKKEIDAKNLNKPSCSGTQPNSNSKNKINRSTSRSNMKEIGHSGSNVFVTRAQWDSARNKSTFGAMTTSLISSLFEEKVLLKSNYKGGQAKNVTDKTIQHKALDSEIIEAIKESVRAYFPDTFKEGGFGIAINNKCAKVREAQRKKQKEETNRMEALKD